MKGRNFRKKRDDRDHVSFEEKKRSFIMFILVGILAVILIFIVIIIIPKEDKEKELKDNSSEVDNSLVKDSGFNKSNNEDESKRDKDKVSITVSPESLTVDGAVIIIEDTNVEHYKWTPMYKLQQEIDGKWEDMELVNPENAIFPDIEYENPTGTMNQSLVWVNKYGKLVPGNNYRIVKESDGIQFYAEFKID